LVAKVHIKWEAMFNPFLTTLIANDSVLSCGAKYRKLFLYCETLIIYPHFCSLLIVNFIAESLFLLLLLLLLLLLAMFRSPV